MTKEEILSQPKHICKRCLESVLEPMFVLEEGICAVCDIQISLIPNTGNVYYVYEHYNKDGIFYVGKGCNYRAWTDAGRSDEWREKAKNGYKVNIVQESMFETDALGLEKELIKRYDNLVNKTL